MNADQKATFILKIKDYFKGKRDIELTATKLEWYWQTLCDYELQDIALALRFHDRDAKRGGFPPRPSDIISKIVKSPTARKNSCSYSRKNVSELGCQNLGEFTFGNPKDTDSFVSEENQKSWDKFSEIFWDGEKIICAAHYENLRYKTDIERRLIEKCKESMPSDVHRKA